MSSSRTVIITGGSFPRLLIKSQTMRHLVVRLFIASFAIAACAQNPLNPGPTRVLGALRPNQASVNPNLVEGRELFNPTWIALDTSASPPILYVSDTGNNRVLAWRNAAAAQNGLKADLVIGQRDMESTTALGPGTSLSTGLAAPSGLAVDAQGNLWVADSGNNRVLRFPRPFQQPPQEFAIPDRVIGQVNFNSRAANGGQPGPTERGLHTATTSDVFQVGLLLDSAQNLWVSDPNNHRVLRFPASELTGNNPRADLVLGQQNFNTRTTQTGPSARVLKTILNFPSGLAMDPGGRLYVADSHSRVVVYVPPFRDGLEASRIAGLMGGTQPPPPATSVNNRALGVRGDTGALVPPECVFMLGGSLAVVDRAAHRIVQYPPFEQWPPEATQFSPTMQTVIGQADFTSFRAWGGSNGPSAGGFSFPLSAAPAAGGNELFVSDSGSHRVLRLSGPPSFRTALQVFGQDTFEQGAPNLLEGREFHFFAGFATSGSLRFGDGVGMAFDGDRLYVADPRNHRVLGFRDARRMQNGAPADIVIGQDDLRKNLINAPSNDPNVTTDLTLFLPAGVAVDANGDLYVADSGNSRVLRFPRPFDQPPGTRHRANLVLGQTGFTTKITDATARNMARPFGLAFTGDGSLLVSDAVHNRVLFFARPPGGDFTSGQNATIVFGQPDFISSGTSADPRRFFSPRGIAVDTDDRLYVADTGRGRIAIFDRAPAAGTDPTPAFSIGGLSSPHGVYVSPHTGEIWATDTTQNRCQRYRLFNDLTQNPSPTLTIPAATPLGVAQDRFGNLFVADAANRIAIHVPTVGIANGANFVNSAVRPLAPNTFISLFSTGARFSEERFDFSTVPIPKELGDVQVTLAGKALPITLVTPTQINALTTNDVPTSGNAEVIVSRVSSGQILAAGSVPMTSVAPGLFTVAANGVGQIAALNQDNTINSASNPARRGSVIQVFGTGPGVISGAPPDGDFPGSAIPGPVPDVLIGTAFVPPENIQYSGLAPSLVGVWQINVRIPENVAPGNSVPFVIRLSSVTNTQPPQMTTIAVRQQ
jgi:uncharacterized protein (TIGR03437 family)